MASAGPWRWLGAAAIALALLACRFDADYAGTRYGCPDLRCPDGFECIDGYCETPGAADAGPADGAADADAAADAAPPADAPGVCDLAALAPDNDGCGDAIALTGGDTAYGDTTGYTNDHQLPTLDCTGKTTAGRDAVYQIDLLAGQTLTATLTPEGWDGALYLYDTCVTPAACLDGSDATASGVAETIDHVAGEAGTYTLVVDATTSAQAGCFTLTVDVSGG